MKGKSVRCLGGDPRGTRPTGGGGTVVAIPSLGDALGIGDALGKFPALLFTVDAFQEPQSIATPVPVVDPVPRELGMEKIEVRQVHVRDEASE